jgi:hypothetical protein
VEEVWCDRAFNEIVKLNRDLQIVIRILKSTERIIKNYLHSPPISCDPSRSPASTSFCPSICNQPHFTNSKGSPIGTARSDSTYVVESGWSALDQIVHILNIYHVYNMYYESYKKNSRYRVGLERTR